MGVVVVTQVFADVCRHNQQRTQETTMTLMEAGIWPCTVLSATFGETDKGVPQVQINVRIDEGPSAGRCCTYEDEVNAKSAPYVARSCRAIGWAGKDLKTLKNDASKWIEATGGKSTVEIKHVEIKRGKKFDEWIAAGAKPADKPYWDKPSAIGRGPKILKDASTAALDEANEAMRAVLAADTGEEPPPDDDRVPF